MLKLAAICVLLSVAVVNSVIIVSNSNFVRVSHNGTHLSVNSDDQKYNNCTLEVGHDLISEHSSDSIKVALLGQDKIIVSAYRRWDEDHYDGEDPNTQEHLYKYSMIIVDSNSCTYKSVLLPVDRISKESHGISLPEVITYDSESYFDVFFPTLNVCAPCRFTKDGSEIQLKHQLDPTIAIEGYNRKADRPSWAGFDIGAVDGKSFGVDQGYVFIFNSDVYNTSTIKLLDRDFKVIREKILNDAETYAVSLKEISAGKIGICFTKKRVFHTHIIHWQRDYNCTLFDTELKPLYSNILPYPPKHTSDGLIVIVDQGKLSAAVIWEPIYPQSAEHPFTLGLYEFDINGKPREPVYESRPYSKLDNYSPKLINFLLNYDRCESYTTDQSAKKKFMC